MALGVTHPIAAKTALTVRCRQLTAGAGTTLQKIALTAAAHGLSGLEFAAGIPGSVGGGIVMNAGAYGGEMRQCVSAVTMLPMEGDSSEPFTYTGEQMEFGYRTSVLKRIRAAVTEAVFTLEEDDPEAIRARIREMAMKRRDKQPLEYPSAGSTFKRPEGYFAGKLIMDAGLRGYRCGDAQVSEKHCGFVINRGHATSAQILQVIEDVSRRVYEDTGIRLQREVICLGEF